jgi:D-alanyl-D-alanine carboxypeptidase
MTRVGLGWLVVGVVLAAAAASPAPQGSIGIQSRPAVHGGPHFEGSISKLPPHVREDMRGSSWHPGCPVGLNRLRLLTLSHWGYDGEVHTGRLVVRDGQAPEVLEVMRKLFNERFPIKRMQRVDAFGGSDAQSMKANNTSAFNCRYVAGTTTWSQHAFGRAIDINPVQNPYVKTSGDVVPKRGEPWADRTKDHPGMIRGGGVVVDAFANIGWEWGGFWSSSKDYMHFSLTGT